jgi:hypothetical protein
VGEYAVLVKVIKQRKKKHFIPYTACVEKAGKKTIDMSIDMLFSS